jgi:NAD+ kinase
VATVGLVVHRERPAARLLSVDIATWLDREGHPVRVGAGDAAAIPELERWAVDDELGPDLDLAVSIGGDGTMLRTVQLVSRHRTPVLGVNVGHLGYLTEVEPGAWKVALGRVFSGDFQVEERMTLDVRRVGDDDAEPRTALNDAVVEKLESGHTVRVGVKVSSRPAISYAADALIVATPTGSTAYNLSAGGPLVSPRLEAIVITPVAAHSLLGRPVVVAGDEVVRVDVLGGAAVLGVDGRQYGPLKVGEAIECRAGAHPARLVTFGERDFWSIVKAKFGLQE